LGQNFKMCYTASLSMGTFEIQRRSFPFDAISAESFAVFDLQLLRAVDLQIYVYNAYCSNIKLCLLSIYDSIRRNKKRMIIYALSENRHSHPTAKFSQKKIKQQQYKK